MSVSIKKIQPRMLLTTLAIIIAVAAGACQQTTVTNSNTTNATTVNANATNTNSTTTTTTGATIDTREPDKYSASITLKLETTGSQNITTPPLAADFARNGADRRISFTIPGSEPVVYLDRPDKRYIILPRRKQYAELTPEATGFEVPSAMTPAQIVEQLKKAKGYELVGDDQLNGRAVTKYRYAGTAKTGTQAGEVKTEAFVYVDKQTGLPLRSESVSEATGGNVQGITGLKMVQELGNIQLEVDPKLFEIPQDYAKIQPEQVRQQVNMIAQAALAIAQQLMRGMSTQSANSNTSQTPAANPSQTPQAR